MATQIFCSRHFASLYGKHHQRAIGELYYIFALLMLVGYYEFDVLILLVNEQSGNDRFRKNDLIY